MKFVQNIIAKQKEAEDKELTFKPQFVANYNGRSRSTIPKSQKLYRIERQPEEEGKPLGYDRAVSRMKKFREEKKELEMKLEKEITGNRYSKQKLDKFKTPSFVDQQKSFVDKKVLLSLEIAITPTR